MERQENDSNDISNSFNNFGLSQQTLKGLKLKNYSKPSIVQKQSFGFSLQGNDLLVSAKTGSGKTLAFVIPILEKLYELKWSQNEGMGALIITPTRELAYQIFDVIKNIGKFHPFTISLITGGKDVVNEQKVINIANIVIATPGRLLQHFDETYGFSANNLQVLVLDEADRILDLGFRDEVDAIFENFSNNHELQILLFSATLTSSISELARLNLKNPSEVFINTSESSEQTPQLLQQSYAVMSCGDKLNFCWSFIKSHKYQKTIIFLSSCKQVAFVYELFRQMKPGVPVFSIHGNLSAKKRCENFDNFLKHNRAVLFATDLASRGLDFPDVHWVIQLDCPEDVETYVHRAGRTARFDSKGSCLCIFTEEEEQPMTERLIKANIPIKMIKTNPDKQRNILGKITTMCTQKEELKERARKAFVGYVKFLNSCKNRKIYDFANMNFEEIAKSMGLPKPPRIRSFEKRLAEKSKKK